MNHVFKTNILFLVPLRFSSFKKPIPNTCTTVKFYKSTENRSSQK